MLQIIEQGGGLSLTPEPIRWCSAAGTGAGAQASVALQRDGSARADAVRAPAPASEWDSPVFEARAPDATSQALAERMRRSAFHARGHQANLPIRTRILFDISDLVYYLGRHPNLTGIQRVQSSIVLSAVAGELLPPSAFVFLSFNAKIRRWLAIPSGFLISLLQDLFLPERERLVRFSTDDARDGILPGAADFDGKGLLDDGVPSVLCLLGAAWVQQDYFHHILAFKRKFNTRFVMMMHDLIPIYARETCDQGTVQVFEAFLRRALRHADHCLCVSENTASDLRRCSRTLSLPEPKITVTRNGSSFDEFLPKMVSGGDVGPENLPDRFVLFVSTIEGRKNHRLIFEVWQRMIDEGDDPPHLVCVGRVGWRSEAFVAKLVETNYLDGKVMLLEDISDADLSFYTADACSRCTRRSTRAGGFGG